MACECEVEYSSVLDYIGQSSLGYVLAHQYVLVRSTSYPNLTNTKV